MEKNQLIKVVISFTLSVIDIYLVASLEGWDRSADGGLALVLFVAGFALAWLFTARFLFLQEKRLKVHSLLWGVPMALAYVLGCRMRRDGTALAGLSKLPVFVIQLLSLSVLTAACIAPVLSGRWEDGRGVGKKGSRMRENFLVQKVPGLCRKISGSCQKVSGFGQRIYGVGTKAGMRQFWQVWLLYTAVIFLCWMPVFLAYYPSVFAYDAEGQLYQVIAHDYSTHHPLIHTLFLGAFFRLGEKLGSYQAGMALHSLIQMLLMAGTFGYALAYLYRRGAAAYRRIVLLVFYAFFPANSILALSTTKDVLFSALTLLCTLGLYRMVGYGGRFGMKDCGTYVLWAVLLLLFRNNAAYAFVLSVPVICIGIYRIRDSHITWKKYFACAVCALAMFAVGGSALKAVTGAHNGSPREMLSVPLQQMARTRVKAEETLSPKMRQDLEQYLPSEWVFAAYNPYLADPVKNRAVIHDNPLGLIRTWLKLGVEYPQIYMDAFLDNSIGYWFVEDRTHARIYGIGTESGFGYLSTDNRTMPAGCEIVEHSYLPRLRAFMERIVSDNCYQKIPVLRLVFAPAFYWWMLCIYMAMVVYKRQYRFLLPVVFLVVYYMTLLLSPTVLIRYMYPFVVTVPVIWCMHTKNNQWKNIQ